MVVCSFPESYFYLAGGGVAPPHPPGRCCHSKHFSQDTCPLSAFQNVPSLSFVQVMAGVWGVGSLSYLKRSSYESGEPRFPTHKTATGKVYAVVETYDYTVGECCNQSYCMASSPTEQKTSLELRAQAIDASCVALRNNCADAIEFQYKVNSLISEDGYGEGTSASPRINHVKSFNDYLVYMRKLHRQRNGNPGLYAALHMCGP